MPALSDATSLRISPQCSRITSILILRPTTGEVGVGRRRLDGGELSVGEVAQPGTELDAEPGAQDEHVIRGAASVGVVRIRP